jgi:hypothetical protein
MPSINKHLETYYTPANVEQYREILESFEWNLWLSKENYYPSLDSIYKFLYKLTRNGKDWEMAYMVIYKEKLDKFQELNEEKVDIKEEKVIQKEEKVEAKEEKIVKKKRKNKKK